MRIEKWFNQFLFDHMGRHPREDWPGEDGQAFYDSWKDMFVKHGVTPDVAKQASIDLMEDPPRFMGEHPAALMKICKRIFKTRNTETGSPADPRLDAQEQSKHCGDCSGVGLTFREVKGKRHQFYCRCPMGRFLELSHRHTAPDVRRRLYDLEAYPGLWTMSGHEPQFQTVREILGKRDATEV